MRRRGTCLVLAVGVSLALAVPGTALAVNDQNIQAAFSSKANDNIVFGQSVALDDKKFSKKGTLRTRVFLSDIVGIPPAADVVAIDFPAEGRISAKGIATCTEEQLEGKSSADAKAACPHAILGAGSASANLAPGLDVSGPVDAFNGPPSGGNPTILLHSNAAAPITLTGVIMDSPAGAQYGKRLTVPVAVPEGPVPPGIAITDFETSVSKLTKKKSRASEVAKKKKRKKTSYVSARCTDGTAEFQGTFTYVNAPTAVAHTTQPCSVK